MPAQRGAGRDRGVGPPSRLAALAARAVPVWTAAHRTAGHLVARAAVAADQTGRSGGRLGLDIHHVLVGADPVTTMAIAARGLAFLLGAAGRDWAPGALLPVPSSPLPGAILAEAGFRVDEVASEEAGRWLPTVDELVRAAGPDTGVVYLPASHDPTGERYDQTELRRLVAWARHHGTVILHDTVDLPDGTPHLLSIALDEGYLEGVVTLGGISTEAVPGVHPGWLVADAPLVERFAIAQGLGPPVSGLVGLALLLDRVAALVSGPRPAPAAPPRVRQLWRTVRELVEPFVAGFPELHRLLAEVAGVLTDEGVAGELRDRRAGMRRVLATNARVLTEEFADLVAEVPPWRGAGHTFVRIPAFDGADSLDTTHWLLREHGLRTLPAPVFGLDEQWWAGRGFFSRLSYAQPTDAWVDGLHRLRQAAADHRAEP